jgi:hypothetical protein
VAPRLHVPGRVRRLIIVAWSHRSLYERLARAFDKDPNVDVILDRRVGQRRQECGVPDPHDRRGVERRGRPDIDEQIQTLGWADVPLP